MKKRFKNIFLFLPLMLLMLLISDTAAQNQDVNIRVNATEYVSGTFEVMIDIENVINLDSGSFDLSFDPDVIKVIDVESGNISGNIIPNDMWRSMDNDTIRILFNLPGADGISGSGYLTKIVFEVVGDTGDSSILDLSDTTNEKRNLISIINPENYDPDLERINANWFNGNVKVNSSTSAKAPVADGTQAPTAAATSIQSTLINPDPEPVSKANVEKPDNPQTPIDFKYIIVYSFVGLIAFIYTITLLK
jgi:hypothetical protein